MILPDRTQENIDKGIEPQHSNNKFHEKQIEGM